MIHDANVSQTANGIRDTDQLDLFGGAAMAQRLATPAADPSSDLKLSRIGHDLRTALNAIMGFSEIMTHQLHGPLGHPKYDEYVSHVRCSGQALLAVTDEVLALAAVNRGQYTNFLTNAA